MFSFQSIKMMFQEMYATIKISKTIYIFIHLIQIIKFTILQRIIQLIQQRRYYIKNKEQIIQNNKSQFDFLLNISSQQRTSVINYRQLTLLRLFDCNKEYFTQILKLFLLLKVNLL
ncbi:unnamed protein product [Paramecium pentaurelia]|uniref:Uncharacterized protein n=1 Tax=Paramecium pentaurelia TaxID=43138 RepID=A0A8S1U0L2_9CILI|nr:unnamed protein product [Paramecium pentaurelia]